MWFLPQEHAAHWWGERKIAGGCGSLGHCWTVSGSLFMVASLSFGLVPIIFWAVLYFWAHRCSMWILNFSYPRINHISKAAWFLLVEKGIEKPRSDYSVCLLLLVCPCFGPSQQTVRKSMYLSKSGKSAPIIFNIFICLFTHEKTQEVTL